MDIGFWTNTQRGREERDSKTRGCRAKKIAVRFNKKRDKKSGARRCSLSCTSRAQAGVLKKHKREGKKRQHRGDVTDARRLFEEPSVDRGATKRVEPLLAGVAEAAEVRKRG